MISVNEEFIPSNILFKKQYNLKKLLEDLNNPQNNFEVINVVGTNGKGSTANYLYQSLVKNNHKVGLFFSPAFLFQNERIQTNGNLIPDADLKNLLEQNLELIKKYELTFFEIWTFLAIQFFVQQKIDVAIIEAGIGGVLDSTNCFEKQKAVCLTSIGFDHVEILGTKIEEIIANKVLISKPGVTIYTSMNNKVHEKIIANTINNKVVYCENAKDETYQKYNKAIAREVLKLFQINFDETIEAPKGRYTVLKNYPNIILDGCHNQNGVEEIIKSISNIDEYCVLFASSLGREKDKMIKVLQKASKEFFITTFEHPKAWDFQKVKFENKVQDWKQFIKDNKSKKLLICGSLYFIPQVYEWIVGEKDVLNN